MIRNQQSALVQGLRQQGPCLEAGSAVCSPGAAPGQQLTRGLQQRWQVAPARLRVLAALEPEVLQRQAALALQQPAHAQPGRPRGPEHGHGHEPAVQRRAGCLFGLMQLSSPASFCQNGMHVSRLGCESAGLPQLT